MLRVMTNNNYYVELFILRLAVWQKKYFYNTRSSSEIIWN